MKELKIMNYCSNVVSTGVDLENENISMITIDVITGDEVATVYFKDGAAKEFDTGIERILDYFDYSYILYNSNTAKEKNEEILKKFLNRNTSYSLEFFVKTFKNA